MIRLLTLSLLLVLTIGVAAAAEPPALSREQIEQIVREFIMAHPEVLVESLRAGDAKRREAERTRAKEAIATHREELLRDTTSPAAGDASGDLTIVEFFDYACPHCKAVQPTLKQLLGDDPKVRIVYRDLPILGGASVTAARAALAAREQGKYLAFHDALLALTEPLSDDVIFGAAAQVGLDVDRLKKDMAATSVTTTLEKNLTLARALGLSGTPTFVIGDELVPGAVPLARLKALITHARQTAH
jgi:protein-disulfide isomerase